MKKFLNKLFSSFYKNILFVSSFVGILVLIAGYTDAMIAGESNWKELFKVVGSTIFASGVFMAIAKSYQFTSIFKDELRSVVYSSEHLEKRSDLVEIWEKVTEALCERKFADISKKLRKDVRDYYLPINQSFYFKDYNYTIHIEYDENDPDYIILKEKTEATIIKKDNKCNIDYKFSSGIPFPVDDNNMTTYELIKVSINGKDLKIDDFLTTDYNERERLLSINFKYDLHKQVNYSIVKEEVKRYHIKSNPYKAHQAAWIYQNLFVDLFYPVDLDLNFLSMGVLKEFSIDKTDMRQVKRLSAKYRGLIYPKQGFFVSFNKK